MKKRLALILIAILSGLYSIQALAVCPICTIAVGAGVGLSRWLGVDDTITGLWIGGLTVSIILWTIGWFNKKNFKFFGRNFLTWIAYYAVIVIPLYYHDILGHPLNRLWGIDKLVLGIVVGSVFFFIGAVHYESLKKRHNNHAYFPFQKVVWPVAPLLILTIIFYFIAR